MKRYRCCVGQSKPISRKICWRVPSGISSRSSGNVANTKPPGTLSSRSSAFQFLHSRALEALSILYERRFKDCCVLFITRDAWSICSRGRRVRTGGLTKKCAKALADRSSKGRFSESGSHPGADAISTQPALIPQSCACSPTRSPSRARTGRAREFRPSVPISR